MRFFSVSQKPAYRTDRKTLNNLLLRELSAKLKIDGFLLSKIETKNKISKDKKWEILN